MKFFGAEHNVFTCEFQISHGTNRDWRRARVLEQANFSGSAGVYTYLAHFIMQWSTFNPVPTAGLIIVRANIVLSRSAVARSCESPDSKQRKL